MILKKLFILTTLIIFITGCGTYRQSVQVDDKAYLLLIGNPRNHIVTIDNDRPIRLDEETTSYNLNGKTATKIQVSIGTHTVTVEKDGKVIIKRKFYVSTGDSFEVQL